jgi:hypothetical protein
MATTFDHPNFTGLKDGKHTFKPFRGDEPRPELPETFWAESALSLNERKAVHAQYEAAVIAWSRAKYRRAVTPSIKPALAAWEAYKTAVKAVEDIYDGFRSENDGAWNARTMRLIEARQVAMDAARELEHGHERVLAVAHDEHDREISNVTTEFWINVLTLKDVARDIGVDIGDMNPGSASADYWDQYGGDRVKNVERIIREQDKMLAQVRSLTGTPLW